jgi:hypothetical protein
MHASHRIRDLTKRRCSGQGGHVHPLVGSVVSVGLTALQTAAASSAPQMVASSMPVRWTQDARFRVPQLEL